MVRPKCDSCGELLPPVKDAYCSYCHAAIEEGTTECLPEQVSGSIESANEDPENADEYLSTLKTSPKIYRVPREFDLSMIFVVTFAYAAAFGLMQALNFIWPYQVGLMVLVTIVGLSQMFLPDRLVRIASILTGIVCMAAVVATVAFIQGRQGLPVNLSDLLFPVFGFGSVLGYCTGVLVGSVFMLTDYMRRFFGLK